MTVNHTHKVAVYGSLKKGMGLHGNMTSINAKYIGEDTVRGTLIHRGQYPGIILHDTLYPGREIPCEVYEVDDRGLAVLDRVEGHPHHYERVAVPIKQGIAWVYALDGAMYLKGKVNIIFNGGWDGPDTGFSCCTFHESRAQVPSALPALPAPVKEEIPMFPELLEA